MLKFLNEQKKEFFQFSEVAYFETPTSTTDITIGDCANVDNMDNNDTMSVSSDITFGTDHDKSITKKYKKMSIEKLRDECVEKSLNSEGTKAILIGRILEYNKKV